MAWNNRRSRVRVKWTDRGQKEREEQGGRMVYVGTPLQRRQGAAKGKLERDKGARVGGLDPAILARGYQKLDLDAEYGNKTGNRAIPKHVKTPAIPARLMKELELLPGQAYATTQDLDKIWNQDHPIDFLMPSSWGEPLVPEGSMLMYLGGFKCDERLEGGEQNGVVRKLCCFRYVFLFGDKRFILGDLNCLTRL